jgi:ubiquinone/menaquinone biosynthesis C-methylase UbiE
VAEAESGWRERLVRDLTGDVLEIGIGAGENLPYYARARHVWGVEPHAKRADEARKAAANAAVPVTIDVAPAEKLPYPDNSFDCAVSSLVFCSVQSPTVALAEIARVLRPGGVLHMVEHVRPDNFLLGTLAQVATPVWSRVAWNCHLDRRTVDTLRQAGWAVDVVDRRLVFVQLTARPPVMGSF